MGGCLVCGEAKVGLRERRVRVYTDAPGFRPAPEEGKQGSACVSYHMVVAGGGDNLSGFRLSEANGSS